MPRVDINNLDLDDDYAFDEEDDNFRRMKKRDKPNRSLRAIMLEKDDGRAFDSDEIARAELRSGS